MKMPGQSMKADEEGIEIDQGVQKMRVSKDEVDLQQPGQQVRVSNGNIDIDQGVPSAHIGQDGINTQQPNQSLQISNEPVAVEATSSKGVEPLKQPGLETDPFIELGVDTTDDKAKADESEKTPDAGNMNKNPFVVVDPNEEDGKPGRPTQIARAPTPAAIAAARAAAERRAAERAEVARPNDEVKRSRMRVRGTVPQGRKDFAGGSWIQKDLTGRDLRGADFSNATIIQCDFEGSDLTGASFEGARITQCSFEDATLQNANFAGGSLTQGWYSGADFSGADFGGARLTQTDFRASDLTMANFDQANELQVKKP